MQYAGNQLIIRPLTKITIVIYVEGSVTFFSDYRLLLRSFFFEQSKNAHYVHALSVKGISNTSLLVPLA